MGVDVVGWVRIDWVRSVMVCQLKSERSYDVVVWADASWWLMHWHMAFTSAFLK